jgi:hypothetical protein
MPRVVDVMDVMNVIRCNKSVTLSVIYNSLEHFFEM